MPRRSQAAVDHAKAVEAKIKKEVPKAERKAKTRALDHQSIAPLMTPLGQVEHIARQALEMAVAMTGQQVAHIEDDDARFRAVQQVNHAQNIKIRDLVALKERYEKSINAAVIILEEMRLAADELGIDLRKRITERCTKNGC